MYLHRDRARRFEQLLLQDLATIVFNHRFQVNDRAEVGSRKQLWYMQLYAHGFKFCILAPRDLRNDPTCNNSHDKKQSNHFGQAAAAETTSRGSTPRGSNAGN